MRGFSNRGVSAVVATVLIVLITVAAVGIVWAFVVPMIRDRLGSVEGCADVDVSIDVAGGYTCYDSINNLVAVNVKKGPNEVMVVGLDFILDFGAESITINRSVSLSGQSASVYELNTTGYSGLKKISVVPKVMDANSEKSCSQAYTEEILNCDGKLRVVPSNICTGFTYGNFGTCNSVGYQNRTVATSLPDGCSGGSPVLVRQCEGCVEANYTYSAWGLCNISKIETRIATHSDYCFGGVAPAGPLTRSCYYPVILNGLLAHYSLDGHMKDTLGGHDGVCAKCPTVTQGVVNEGYSFNGSNNNSINLGAAFNSYSNNTVIQFVNYKGGGNGVFSFATGESFDSGNNFGWRFRFNGRPWLLIGTGSYSFAIYTFGDSPPMPVNQYAMLSIGLESGKKVQYCYNATCYINTTAVPAFRSGGFSSGIGTSANYPGEYFNGTIDEVLVYNRLLNESEITTIYNSLK